MKHFKNFKNYFVVGSKRQTGMFKKRRRVNPKKITCWQHAIRLMP